MLIVLFKKGTYTSCMHMVQSNFHIKKASLGIYICGTYASVKKHSFTCNWSFVRAQKLHTESMWIKKN